MDTPYTVAASTKTALNHFAAQPSHAVLLVGEDGIGKEYLAAQLVGTLLGMPVEKVRTSPKVHSIEEAKSIGIDAIRNIRSFLKTRALSSEHLRIVSIPHAERATLDAQNAILKMLEDPPERTVFVLTAPRIDSLLPTVRSRCTIIRVQRPPKAQLKQQFTTLYGFNIDSIDAALQVAGPLPGLVHSLVANKDSHTYLEGIETAKKFIRSTKYERILALPSIATSQEQLEQFLYCLQLILRAAMKQSGVKTGTINPVWLNRLKALHTAVTASDKRANTKLAGLYIALEL